MSAANRGAADFFLIIAPTRRLVSTDEPTVRRTSWTYRSGWSPRPPPSRVLGRPAARSPLRALFQNPNHVCPGLFWQHTLCQRLNARQHSRRDP